MKENIAKILNSIKQIISANQALCKKVLAVIIIIITILVIASCFRGTKYGNSSGNSSNVGLAVQEGKWIYYVEVDDDEPVGICRTKLNGKKTEKITDGYMYCLNIIDDYIYCLEYDEDDEKNNLIKIKTNGKNKEILARDIDEGQIVAVEDWVYYYKNDKLYRVKLNGTDREEVSDKEITYYQIEGKWIYYIYEKEGSQYIAKMELDGEDTKRIAKTDSSEYEALLVKGGKIYYIMAEMNEEYDTDYSLYKMNKNGKKAEKICNLDTNIASINMQEDRIYYTVTEDYDSYMIKSIKYNGTDKTQIKKSGMAININLVEDWIFFIGENEDNNFIMKMITTEGEKEKNI